MTTLDTGTTSPAASEYRLLACLPVYAATLFLSALLLFWVQPLFSKMVLPLLGGSSAVWSVSMVVFQALLLGGYVYAWAITARLPLRLALGLHLVLLACAAALLPIGIAAGFDRPPQQGVTLWVIALFVASVGLPCFAISATAPLLQAWFARTGHRQAANPYVLYGASNLGSFVLLLAYPFLIEPRWGLAQQSHLWSLGFALLAVGIAVSGVLALGGQDAVAIATRAPSIRWPARLQWILLAFIPSGLLVAVTAHITTDVASAPFLWIAPLAVYLLTFILCFSDRPLLPARRLQQAQPVTLGLAALLFLWGPAFNWAVPLAGNLAIVFVAAMVCHSELYRTRPEPARLTEFYAWMSLGGVLGGCFAALLAPQIFSTVLEYPLLLVAAIAVRTDARLPARTWLREAGLALGLAVLLVLPHVLIPAQHPDWRLKYDAGAVIALAMVLMFLGARPARLACFAAGVFLVTSLFPPGQEIVARARSFYGAYKVLSAQDGRYHLLFHGTTMHGAERMDVLGRPEPLAYYYPGGPYSDAIAAMRAADGGHFGRVAAVGLGIGALSCYARSGEDWRYYELDPLMVRLAEDPTLFRTFRACGGARRLVLGDARLTLRDAAPGIDLLILDAFSSDSIPAHLLTAEALALYRSKLTPHGMMAFNISNRNLELKRVVAAAAAANGLVTAVALDGNPPDPAHPYRTRAEIAVVAQSADDLKRLKLGPGWRIVPPDGERVWTDDYSNILGVLLEKFRQG